MTDTPIDWKNDDGVNFDMINDFMRNQFYDRILSRYVKNQDCIDIGFGTGLLTILALKHGANHVIAYEGDADRYQLGCKIIQQLGLQNRVELIHKRYTRIRNSGLTSRPVIFTETVDRNLWQEGLWKSLPIDSETIFLPGRYFLELWAVEVSTDLAHGLHHSGLRNLRNSYFLPGVEIDPKFVSVVNSLAGTTAPDYTSLPDGVLPISTHWSNWGNCSFMQAIQLGTAVAKYEVQNWLPDINEFTLTVPTHEWHNKTILLVPRAGMAQDQDCLYLDTASSWGPAKHSIILKNPQQDLIVNHNVNTGIITYSFKDIT